MRFRTNSQVHTHLHALKDDAGPLPPYPCLMSRPQGTRVKGLQNISGCTSKGCGGRRTHHQGLVEFVVQVSLLCSLHQILRRGHEGASERGKEASGRVRSTPRGPPSRTGDRHSDQCLHTNVHNSASQSGQKADRSQDRKPVCKATHRVLATTQCSGEGPTRGMFQGRSDTETWGNSPKVSRGQGQAGLFKAVKLPCNLWQWVHVITHSSKPL